MIDMKIIFKIILVIGTLWIMTTTTTATRKYRSVHTLKAESKAILPGRILNYNNGQLAFIPSTYRNISSEPVHINYCSSPSVYNHISQTSSCPWKFILNVDNNRIPREIYEAKCRTTTCLGTNMDGCMEQRCEEIKYFTWVKRRISSDSFTNVLEPISVGCTCACNRRRGFRSLNGLVMCL